MERHHLSPRETSVLRLLAWGYTNLQIATRLSRSVKTIESQKAAGMRKLKLRSRADVVRYAVENGWLQRDATPDTEARFADTPGA